MPNALDLVAILFLSILLIILGNSHQLLSYYGLDSSTQLIQSSVGSVLNVGLGHLDSFKFTDTVVTFLIWAAVGVLCFSIVQALASVYHEVELDTELSSKRYIHPSTFTKASFWRHVITNFAILGLALLVTALALFALKAFILPIAFTYSRTFLIGLSIGSIGNLLIGLAMIYIWLTVLDVCFRVIFYHRQIASA